MVDYSRRIGLDGELGAKIVHMLIEYSKLAQTEVYYKQSIEAFLASKEISRVSIVGAGRMGVWFAKYFRCLEIPVFIYDEDAVKARSKARELSAEFGKSLRDAAKSDLVVLAVPIEKTPRVILNLMKFFDDRGSHKMKIMELSSVKSKIARAGLIGGRQKNIPELYSIHPLFGAGAHPFARNTILEVYPKDTEFVQGIFPHFSVVALHWKAHDILMGLFLTVPHSLALVFANLLSQKHLSERGADMKAPSYAYMFELSRRVLGENPEVYFEIEASNPSTKKALKDLEVSLNKLRKSLDSRGDFVKFFNNAKRAIEMS
jgi:prephenate dehydrogenase